MHAEKNAASVEVLLYWVDNYLLNDNVGPFEKRLFDWWIGEGFFCVSNFKNTDTGVSAELILLLGDSIYDIIRSLENDNSKYSLNDSVQRKMDEGWDLSLKIPPSHYYVKDTENNRVLIMRLLRDNIRNFEILKFITKEDCGVHIIKSVVINVIRNKKQGNIEKEGI